MRISLAEACDKIRNHEAKHSDFPIGTRVKVSTYHENMHFFDATETGTVIRNFEEDPYGIAVKFDKVNEHGVTAFYFRPISLRVIPEEARELTTGHLYPFCNEQGANMDNLKPCPSCESLSIFVVKSTLDEYYVKCTHCRMLGPVSDFKDKAWTAWNNLPRNPEVTQPETTSSETLTLRDQLAITILSETVSHYLIETFERRMELSHKCYDMADEMLKARQARSRPLEEDTIDEGW